MLKSLSVAEAKARLSSCIRQVEEGEPILLTRHGRAVAALVSAEDLEHLRRLRAAGPEAGLYGLAGGWEDSQELVEAVCEHSRTSSRQTSSLD